MVVVQDAPASQAWSTTAASDENDLNDQLGFLFEEAVAFSEGDDFEVEDEFHLVLSDDE